MTSNKDIDNHSLMPFGKTLLSLTHKNLHRKLQDWSIYRKYINKMFFGHNRVISKTCPICDTTDNDPWLHVLLKCKQHHIHSLQVKRHNKAVWEIRNLLISHSETRCLKYMHAGTFHNNSPENRVFLNLHTAVTNSPRTQLHKRQKNIYHY